MLNTLSVILWVPAFAVKLALALVGVVIVPLTSTTNPIWGNNEHPVAPNWYRPAEPEWWRDYVWRAWRNPVNNLRYIIDEPVPDTVTGMIDPESFVRANLHKGVRASRFIRSGLYSEYWYLRATKDREVFEFRAGWKFSGVPGFAPTLQLRKGS